MVVVAIAGAIGWYLYSKPVADISNLKPEYSLEAAELFAEFSGDESGANTKYLGKIIEVTGTIQVLNSDKGGLSVILFTNDEIFGINCGLSAGQDKAYKKYKSGDKIILRGECAGYDMDVVLTRCVIIE